MFYWYKDPIVGPGFSKVHTLTRYHYITKQIKSLKLQTLINC